uniref:Guanine deaminase n=2 Tax=Phaffia rhodozyma TaxID=264483 RepID=A0A1C9U6B6_PHARH|nr:guanine deaminase [Phaffia rhodozyma]
MDSNCPPEYIEPSASASIEETRSLITHIQSLSPSPADALVRPIITPRFAISCSPELLRGLGELAKEEDTRATKVGGYKMAIQTHMGENAGEIAFTKQLFKDAKAEKPWDGTYAGVYDRFGLLGERTILAHCVHLEEKELQLLQSTKSGISHCPISNFHLRSGCARIAEALDRGIKVGLGSDCGGGNEAGILPQIRAAMNTSKMVGMYLPASSNPGSISQQTHLSLSNTFHMATLGGAALCGLQDVIGNFKKGKQFDALLVDLTGKRGPGVWWTAGEEGEEGDASWLESGFERFIFTGDDRSISNVWVRGKLVGGTDA